MPPVSKSGCLEINYRLSQFMSNGKAMFDYQFWVVMKQITNLYVYWYGGGQLAYMDVNDCIRLPASQTIQNAMNYVYYAASKSTTIYLVSQNMRCTSAHSGIVD